MKKLLFILLFLIPVNVNAMSDCEYFVLPALGINQYQNCVQNPSAYDSFFIYHYVDFYVGSDLVKSELIRNETEAIPPDDPFISGFIFTGWNTTFTFVTTDTSVYAEFGQQSYTLNYKDYDGSTLKIETVLSGEDGDPPLVTRTGYNFVGWSSNYNNVSNDLTLIAGYSLLSYTVNFYDEEGSLLSTQNVNYNYSAAAPIPPAVDGKSFDGWSLDFDNVKASLEVFASYSVDSLTVNFYWGDLLKSEEVAFGGSATAPDVNKQGFTFTGWDKEFSNITTSISVNALFESDIYEVVFLNFDGDIEDTQSVAYLDDAIPPNIEKVGYIMEGWDGNYNGITGNVTLTPILKIETFNVVYTNFDGTLFKNETVNYGESCETIAPLREGYVFTGLSESCSNVTSNLSLSILYETATFTVLFKDGENIVKEELVEYGKCAEVPDYTPAGNEVTWPDENCNITADTVISVALTPNSYTVTFKNYNGTTLKTTQVNYGDTAVCEQPGRAGYRFTGWSSSLVITNDKTLIATYEPRIYKVDFYLDGTLIDSQRVRYGKDATAPEVNLEGSIFIGWDNSFVDVFRSKTVNAITEKIVLEVVYLNFDSTEIALDNVEYGTDSVPPIISRIGYSFLGWTQDHSNITESNTLMAIYEPISYEVNFIVDEVIIDSLLVEYGDNVIPSDDYLWEYSSYTITSNIEILGQVKECVAFIYDSDDIFLAESSCEEIQVPVQVGFEFIDWRIEQILHKKYYYPIFEKLIYNVKFHYEDSIVEELVSHGEEVVPPTSMNNTFIDTWDKPTVAVTGNLDVYAVILPDYYPELKVEKNGFYYSLQFGEDVSDYEISYFVINGVKVKPEYVLYEIDTLSWIDKKVNWINVTLEENEELESICLENELEYLYDINEHLVEETFFKKIINWIKSFF